MSSDLKLRVGLADLCVADFWGGHHLPHVQIPVHKHTTADEVRAMLTHEVAMDAVARLPEGRGESPEWYAAANKAIAELSIFSDKPFAGDLVESPPEDGMSLYGVEVAYDHGDRGSHGYEKVFAWDEEDAAQQAQARVDATVAKGTAVGGEVVEVDLLESDFAEVYAFFVFEEEESSDD